MDDLAAMQLALNQARCALENGDVPVGAIVVRGDDVVGAGHNRRDADGDPTAHAEMLALRSAASSVGTWRLAGCEMYVTLEPCVMCAGAAVLARVSRLVFGADDAKAGAVGALYDIPRDPRLNHRVEVTRGVLADPAAAMLRDFFAGRRS